MGKQEQLRSESVGRLLLKFSIPAMIGMMVTAMYNVVDRIFVGRIGYLAMTGIGLNFPFMTMLMAFSMLIGLGGAARISIRLGEGKKEGAEKVLGNALVLLFLIMTSVMVLLLLTKGKLLYLFGASEVTFPFANDYITIILYGSVFQGIGFGLNHCMRGEGQPAKAMITMIIGAGLNILLDPIFIFGFNMGIKGAALATITSQFVSMGWVLFHYFSKNSVLKFRLENLRLDKKVVGSILSIGMSPFAIQIAASMVTVISNNALKTHGGDIAISAMTVVNSLAIFVLMPIFGINQGSQPVIGFNYGARQYDRVKKAWKLSILGASVISTTGFLLTYFATEQMVRIFNSDPQLIAVASNGMKIMFFFLPIIGFQIVSSNYFQAVGKAHKSMFLSILRKVIIQAPMLLLLPRFFGLNGVWLAGPISDFGAAAITAIFIYVEIKNLNQMEQRQVKQQEKVEISAI